MRSVVETMFEGSGGPASQPANVTSVYPPDYNHPKSDSSEFCSAESQIQEVIWRTLQSSFQRDSDPGAWNGPEPELEYLRTPLTAAHSSQGTVDLQNISGPWRSHKMSARSPWNPVKMTRRSLETWLPRQRR